MSALEHAEIEFSRSVLQDKDAPPQLVLAAWRCLFRGDCEALHAICRLALAKIEADRASKAKP